MQISQKVFLVTGGGNGIGREVVRTLLARGARVAACDLSADGLAETVRIANAGDRLSTHVLDVSNNDAVVAAVAEIASMHGQLDGVVNVAGIIQPFVPVAELDRSIIEKVMNVNFWGVVNVTTAALPLLLERPVAAITNVSSMGGFIAFPGQTVYGASKAAVKLFTEGLQAELRESHVQVTLVFPGGVSTDIAANSGAEISNTDPESAPIELTTPQSAATQIVAGLEKGKARVLVGKDAKALDIFSRMMPVIANSVIAKKLADLTK